MFGKREETDRVREKDKHREIDKQRDEKAKRNMNICNYIYIYMCILSIGYINILYMHTLYTYIYMNVCIYNINIHMYM